MGWVGGQVITSMGWAGFGWVQKFWVGLGFKKVIHIQLWDGLSAEVLP